MKKIEKFIKKIQQEAELKKRIISTTDYIEWLYEFTKLHPHFTDIAWEYNKRKNISDEDYEKVQQLDKFYSAVDEYFTKNMLIANGIGSMSFYKIKYKDVGFVIGLYVGQGAMNYVERHEDTEGFYPFENIMNDEEDVNLSVKKERLSELESFLKELKALSVPYAEVGKKVNSVFKSEN